MIELTWGLSCLLGRTGRHCEVFGTVAVLQDLRVILAPRVQLGEAAVPRTSASKGSRPGAAPRPGGGPRTRTERGTRWVCTCPGGKVSFISMGARSVIGNSWLWLSALYLLKFWLCTYLRAVPSAVLSSSVSESPLLRKLSDRAQGLGWRVSALSSALSQDRGERSLQ